MKESTIHEQTFPYFQQKCVVANPSPPTTHTHTHIQHRAIVRNRYLCNFLINPDLRVSSSQCGLFSPDDSSFTPESCRSLLLRSSSLKLENWELRTEDRASQLLFDRLQSLSLKKTKKNVHFIFCQINDLHFRYSIII